MVVEVRRRYCPVGGLCRIFGHICSSGDIQHFHDAGTKIISCSVSQEPYVSSCPQIFFRILTSALRHTCAHVHSYGLRCNVLSRVNLLHPALLSIHKRRQCHQGRSSSASICRLERVLNHVLGSSVSISHIVIFDARTCLNIANHNQTALERPLHALVRYRRASHHRRRGSDVPHQTGHLRVQNLRL